MGHSRNKRGFSLLELMIVVMIMLAVAAMAIPSFTTYISTYRLRGAMTDAAGMLQQMRMEAVKRNAALQISTSTSNGQGTAWVDLPGRTANAWDAGEPFVLLPRNISVQSTDYPGGTTLETSLGYHKQDPTTAVIRFNSRGLPCVYPSGSSICENNDGTYQVGFVIYFRNNGAYGVPGWGAITITPAGRIRTWVWNGSSYSGQ